MVPDGVGVVAGDGLVVRTWNFKEWGSIEQKLQRIHGKRRYSVDRVVRDADQS